MRNVFIIAARDFKMYRTSMVMYLVCFIFYLLSGYLFYAKIASISMASMNALSQPQMYAQLNFSAIFIPSLYMDIAGLFLIMVPMITMRSFSEEKKNGTYELLVSYPITDWEIVAGKFLSVFYFLLCLTSVILFQGIMARLIGGQIEWGPMLLGFLGLNLLGVSFLAVGLFASSLTENQVVAAFLSFGLLLLFWVLGWMSEMTMGWGAAFLKHASIFSHSENFYKGIFSTQDILFFVLFVGFFFFATLRVMELRRWQR